MSEDSNVCPRCGTDLKAGFTAAHKVCADCPSCGGRLVTLPVLRDGLGMPGVAALTRAAREAEHIGCRCPACGEPMGLLKVGVGDRKVEIDVCAKCLSVWCDRGEFEDLVPPPKPRKDPPTLKERVEAASPEAQGHVGQALLGAYIETDALSDISLEDIALDLVRLVVGAPTLWRKVRPVTPIVAVLLTAALPVGQAVAYYAWHTSANISRRCFWVLDSGMMGAGGFELSSSLFAPVSWPFLQTNGNFAIILAVLLFPVLSITERRVGSARFLLLLSLLWLTAMGAHVLQSLCNLQEKNYLCGIAPLAVGVVSYLHAAYPNLRYAWVKNCTIASIYLCLVVALLLLVNFLACMVRETYSFGLLSLVSCAALGVFLGRRQRAHAQSEVC